MTPPYRWYFELGIDVVKLPGWKVGIMLKIGGFTLVNPKRFCYNDIDKYYVKVCSEEHIKYSIYPFAGAAAEEKYKLFRILKEELLCAVTARVRRVIFLY